MFSQDFRFTLYDGLTLDFKGDWFYEYYTYEYFYHTYLSSPGSYNTKLTLTRRVINNLRRPIMFFSTTTRLLVSMASAPCLAGSISIRNLRL